MRLKLSVKTTLFFSFRKKKDKDKDTENPEEFDLELIKKLLHRAKRLA